MSQLVYNTVPVVAFDGQIASHQNETEIQGEAFAQDDREPGLYAIIEDGTNGRLIRTIAGGMLAVDITDGRGGFIAGEFSREPLVGPTENQLYTQGDSVPFMRKGTLWVISETTVNYGDPVHVRRIFTPPERFGGVRSTVDGTDTEILPGAQFISESTAINQLVKIRFHLPG